LTSGQLLAQFDANVLGRAMLDAARAAGIGVTITLVESGRPRNVYVSEAAANVLGRSVEELLTSDPMSHIAPEDLPAMRERLARRARGEVGERTSEVLIIRKDGTRLPVEFTASAVTIDGQPAVLAFIVDVSERKAAERQRLQNEARFRELIESAPEPIGIVRGGHFCYANRACVAALGFSDPQALYATALRSLLDPEEAELREQNEARILEGKASSSPLLYHPRRPDGSTVMLEVSTVYFEYEAKPSVLLMARDVTARKRLEAQLVQAERLAALGTLAAGVAHEINNPLAYLMLNLEWIQRKLPAVAEARAAVDGLMAMIDEARQGAQRVSAIVRELRGLSRAEGEARRPVDLAAVAEAAIQITAHEIGRRARVTTCFEAARPVWGNEARLVQVVTNLLMNAAEAMPEGRVKENEIRVAVREDAGGRAVLEVGDNGEGISSEVLSRVFDPFFTTKPSGHGTGLGLSICHGIITSLGGQIAAYSEPGLGTAFRILLPSTEPVADDAGPPADAAPEDKIARE
jgi:PAS domain S-box-containing protein